MAKIKIDDLPVLEDLTPEQMKGLFGGRSMAPPPAKAPVHAPVLRKEAVRAELGAIVKK